MVSRNKDLRGFTLIELIITMVILGIVSTVVLVTINPIQKFAATRDAGRTSTVTQIGHAVGFYMTSHEGSAPPEASWDVALIQSGDLRIMPTNPNYSVNGATPCQIQVRGGGYCYDATDAQGMLPIIVFARLESDSSRAKCASMTDIPWAVFSTADARGGIVCTTDSDNPPTSGRQNFRN
jgi:prepilin-type N-terminal cleavage/methylation domain-containing protein